jgi:tetratricopeptide (TPR) repeat protein
MTVVELLSRCFRQPVGACLALNLALVGCATPSTSKVVANGTSSPPNEQVAQPSVHAVPVQTSNVDGQMSWIIQPNTTRIPKVAGIPAQLPPHIESRLSYAFDLAQRGATYTAEAEFQAVLGLCALEIDSRDGRTNRREALRQGLIALHEADQFCGDQVDWRDSADVRRVAAGHITPVLSQAQTPVDSIQAVQAYYAFAEQRLAYACDGLPEASLAYYGLARTIAVPGMKIPNPNGKAALLHRVALAIAPQNMLAANELGVLLAQHGRLEDAERLFQQCVATDPTPENWRNLAVVYARRGNEQASRSATVTADSLAAERQRNPAMRAGEQPKALASEGSDAGANPNLMARSNGTPNLANDVRR